MKYPLTPGADRCITRASALAKKHGNGAIRPIDMLDALLAEEVVASKILSDFGVTANVSRRIRLDSTNETFPNNDIDQLLDCAWSVARQTDSKPEVTSEHLLCGLLKVESIVSSQLAGLGLTAQTGFNFEDSENYGPPIEVDFSLAAEITHSTNTGTADAAATGGATTNPPTSVLRIIDAAANRLREGLRVLDDYARFILNDPALTERIKQLRHRTVMSLAHVDPAALQQSRDTAGDVGTSIHTVNELRRASLQDVVAANLKRTQESARSLEEFGKLIHADFALAMKQIRYDLYILESAIPISSGFQTSLQCNQTALPEAGLLKTRLTSCQLYVLISEAGCTTSWKTVVESAIAGGADIIQLREKQLPDRELIQRARWIRAATRDTNTLFIMNDRPDIAALADADGVHVGQDEATVADARSIIGPDKLIGLSTHSVEQATTAIRDGADYIGVGPVFPSTTKSFDSFVGLKLINEIVAAKLDIPFFAIGGITHGNLQSVIDAGAGKVAVSSVVCKATKADDACQSLKRDLEKLKST